MKKETKYFLSSWIITLVLLRIYLFLFPLANLNIGVYNIHHFFTGAVILIISIFFLVIKILPRTSLILSGIGTAFILDQFIYLLATDGSDGTYLTQTSFYGIIVINIIMLSLFGGITILNQMKKNKKWLSHLKVLGSLIVLQYVIDTLYIFLYPTVNPVRATLIGATAFLILWIPSLQKFVGLKPWISFVPIYSSAFFGALLVQQGIVVSKSALSATAHIIILILTYLLILMIQRGNRK